MGFISESILGAAGKKAAAAAIKFGKTPEQKKVIDYFLSEGGCLSKVMKDAEYDQLVNKVLQSINWEEKVLSKLGIDKSQISEIEPIVTEGYYSYSSDLNEDDKLLKAFKVFYKTGKDDKFRSSAYQKTYMYFSSDQVYLYQMTFHMDKGDTEEVAKEFFYKDITSFTTISKTTENISKKTSGCLKKKDSAVKSLTTRTEFKLIVSGDEFSCSLNGSEMREDTLQGLKAKLREKKNT